MIRHNLTDVDTTHKDYEPLAAVPTYTGSETHGGEDVAVFAQGNNDNNQFSISNIAPANSQEVSSFDFLVA